MVAGTLDYYQSSETYSKLYEQIRAGNVHPGTRAIVNKALKAVRQYLGGEQKRALDIGCGSGYLLAALKEEGFDCLGLDFNPDMCRIVSEIHRIPVRTSTLEELILEDLRFDLIVLSHVLEHLEEPIQSLRKMRSLLNPRGVLFVCLPNRNFIRQKASLPIGQLSEMDYPPHHVSFWSARALSYALQEAGFRVIECHSQSYPEPLQTQHSLVHTYHVPDQTLARAIAWSMAAIGKLIRLEGANLFGVGLNEK